MKLITLARAQTLGAAVALLTVMLLLASWLLSPPSNAKSQAVAPPVMTAPENGAALLAGPVRFEGTGVPGRTVSVAAGPAEQFSSDTGSVTNPLAGEAEADGAFVFSDEILVSASGRWSVDVVIDVSGDYAAGAVQMLLDGAGELLAISAVSEPLTFTVGPKSTPAAQLVNLAPPAIETPRPAARIDPSSEAVISGHAEPGAWIFLAVAPTADFAEAAAGRDEAAGAYFSAVENAVANGLPLPFAPEGLIRVDDAGEWTTEWAAPLQPGSFSVAASQVLASVNGGRYGTSAASEPTTFSVAESGMEEPAPSPSAVTPSMSPSRTPAPVVAADDPSSLEPTGAAAVPGAVLAVLLIGVGAALIARRRASRSTL